MVTQEIDYNVNILRAILWQYESAEKIVGLAQAKQAFVSQAQSQFWSDWERDVFNVNTANDFGLSVWARILNISLGFESEPDLTKVAFGFGTDRSNFASPSNFGNRAGGFVGLTLEQKRIVIKLRYIQLTHRPSVPIINESIANVFGEGLSVFVYDNYEMEYAAYVFNQEPASQIRVILEKFDLLPRPSAVGVRWLVERKQSWGFGRERLNFGNGNFGA